MCGTVGLKPTYGRVSRYGLMALASSLDTIGPITRSVEDAALVMEVIEGKDHMTGHPWKSRNNNPRIYLRFFGRVTLGIPKSTFGRHG